MGKVIRVFGRVWMSVLTFSRVTVVYYFSFSPQAAVRNMITSKQTRDRKTSETDLNLEMLKQRCNHVTIPTSGQFNVSAGRYYTKHTYD